MWRAAITLRETKRSQTALRLRTTNNAKLSSAWSSRPISISTTASLSLALSRCCATPRISLTALPMSVDCNDVNGFQFQTRRHQSSTSSPSSSSTSSASPSMEDATTLEEVLTAVEHQMIEDDRRRSIEKPTPYFSLLHYPSRAAWRSTDHVMGDKLSKNNSQDNNNNEKKGQGNNNGQQSSSVLSQTQFNLIQHSERTNKQLKRTYKRIMEVQKSLAIKRERERRLAANLSNPNKAQHQERMEEDGTITTTTVTGKPEGNIKDDRGRRVGDWREKKKLNAPPASLCDDPSVALALSMGLQHSKQGRTNKDIETMDEMLLKSDPMANVRSAKTASKLAKSKDMSVAGTKVEKPVGYGAEQSLTNMRYRMGPNYEIVKRVLAEVQSLLGGKGRPSHLQQSKGRSRKSFRPKRVLDFGCGAGSSSAAALDVFGVTRSANNKNGKESTDGIDWIHSIDASQSMRETTEKVLNSVLQSAPWEADDANDGMGGTKNNNAAFGTDELAEYDRIVKEIRGDADAKRLERQRKRNQKWEKTWTKRTDFRTRLTFGESIVDASSFYSDKQKNAKNKEEEEDDRPALPWQQQLDEQRRRTAEKKKATHQEEEEARNSKKQQKVGSFDLILCSYTLSEFPNVPSSLAATALLWEKLAPGGVVVFVEPGTPDGFNILRSIRSMLLECCPPPEVRERRRRAFEAGLAEEGEDGDGDGDENDENDAVISAVKDEDVWHEECHVIAPCTHNGTCPMSRHQRNHTKRNTRFSNYETRVEDPANEDNEEGNSDDGADDDDNEEDEEMTNANGLMSDWEGMNEDEREEMKMMVGVEDMSDEEMMEMMKYIDESMDEDEGDEDDSEEEEDSDSDEEEDGDYAEEQDQFFNIDQDNGSPSSKSQKSTTKKTDVFDASFCSFVHNFPGGTSRKKGEKFSYLVLQKRVNDPTAEEGVSSTPEQEQDALDVDVVDLLSKSIHHSNKLKKEELQLRKEQRDFNSHGYGKESDFHKEYFDTTYGDDINYHNEQVRTTLQKAVQVEEEYLDSTMDGLGLELLNGDNRRKGWGRLIRAPLKRKGHVLLDYCSAGCGGGGGNEKNKGENRANDDDANDEVVDVIPDGTKGRITRQKVSRGWSARAAPGSYSAARKARWGGLWPDLSERVKLTERKDKRERRKE